MFKKLENSFTKAMAKQPWARRNWKLNWRDSVLKQCLTSKQYLTALRKWLPRCFWSMEKTMGCCICSQGNYFGGHNSQNWIS
jgi:hypothetical protein